MLQRLQRLQRPVWIAIYGILLTFSVVATAQDNVGEDSTVVYPSDYFVEWAPVTAQDMLDRIPGLSGGSGGRRGTGARAYFRQDSPVPY